MSAIYLLVGVSLLVALGFLAAFFWSVKNGQYDDDYSPAVKMLFEDSLTPDKETKSSKPKSK
jgi:cbb3-type cytochrome oxidase maturation protein